MFSSQNQTSAILPVSNLVSDSSTLSTTTTINNSPKIVRLMVSVLTVPSISRLVPILINAIPNLDPIARQELVASLFQGERFVSSNLFEVGRSNSFFVMLKEQLVGFLNALTDILYSLRSNLLPECFTLSEFGDMTREACCNSSACPTSGSTVCEVQCNGYKSPRQH
jgi:hypothetical protein